MSFVLRMPASYEPERRYSARVVFGEHLGLDPEWIFEDRSDVVLEGEGGRLSMPDGLFGTSPERWLTPASLPAAPFGRWELPEALSGAGWRNAPQSLPVLFATDQDPGWRREGDGEWRLELDVLGTVFFFLSRYEEIARPERDRHGRFPAEASLAWQGGFLERPLADEHIAVLGTAVSVVWPGITLPRRLPRTLPTHDVDKVSWYGDRPGLGQLRRLMSRDLKKGRGWRVALSRLSQLRRLKKGEDSADPYWTFDWLMAEVEGQGLWSTYYFLADPGDHPFSQDYRPEDPAIRRVIRDLGRHGHELGLHGGYYTLDDAERLGEEAARLAAITEAERGEAVGMGGRQHVLRWSAPETWRAYEAAGLACDSSLTFADWPGFRAGTCHAYPVFDAVDRRELALREQPLIAMEVSYFSKRYGNFSDTTAVVDHLLGLKQRCREQEGDFVFLWHNHRLLSPEMREVFRAALAG